MNELDLNCCDINATKWFTPNRKITLSLACRLRT